MAAAAGTRAEARGDPARRTYAPHGIHAAAAASAFAQNQFDRLPSGFNIDSTVLGSLTTVNDETIVVALAAGVAGMLARCTVWLLHMTLKTFWVPVARSIAVTCPW